MAKKIAYFAIDANGVEHTRNSARAYTHTVFFQRSKSAAVASIAEFRKQDLRNAQYHLDCVEVGYHKNLMSFAHYKNDLAEQARSVAESLKSLEGAKTAEEFADKRAAEMAARIEATDWSKWYSAGWCGRLDLAQKLQAQYEGSVIVAAQAK